MPNLFELARVRVIACSSFWDSTVYSYFHHMKVTVGKTYFHINFQYTSKLKISAIQNFSMMRTIGNIALDNNCFASDIHQSSSTC